MKQDLSITREFLEAILVSIDEGIHAVDEEGRTIFYNHVAADHDGLTKEEVIGKPILDVFPSLTEKTSTLLQAIKDKQPICHQAQAYVNLHGKMIETINTSLPIFIEGRLVGAVEIAKDYSKMKALSEKLLHLQQISSKVPQRLHQKKMPVKYSFTSILTKNQAFINTIDEGKRLAQSDSSVLVYGESGTGKELFVQGLHFHSKRAKGPFIVQNCAALPESLLESILFGTAKGSYTGATERPGLFELADGGTLFLDELHALPIQLQAKLLRVLEDGLLRRVGSSTVQAVDVRVIAAMNISPEAALAQQKIRSDLFYRLNILSFELPPLRERKDDILFLAEHFLQKYKLELRKDITGFDVSLSSFLIKHHWPGNVRELKHTVEYMVNVSMDNVLTLDHLPPTMKQHLQLSQTKQLEASHSLQEKVQVYERELIEQALAETNGNILRAAKLLKIPRQTLQYKLRKLNIHQTAQ